MTQYDTVNVKFSNSQLTKLKPAIKNGTGVTLNFPSNIINDSNDEYNFLQKLLLTNTQFSRLLKAFTNNSSANKKLSKNQLHKIRQSGGILGRPLGPLLIGNALKPLAKNVLIPLGLTAAASASDAAIRKKMFGSWFTTLIISNEEMEDIMKIVKSLEDSCLLIKDVSETIKNQVNKQKGGFLGMLLGTLGASLLENILTEKGAIRAIEGTIRAGKNF